MKRNYVVKESFPFGKPSKIVFGGSYDECDAFCEKQRHYHSIYSSVDKFWKPEGGLFQIIEIGA